MKKLILISIVSLTLSCSKKCNQTLDGFIASNPYPYAMGNVNVIAYEQLDCDIYKITAELKSGGTRIIHMKFNHEIINEQ